MAESPSASAVIAGWAGQNSSAGPHAIDRDQGVLQTNLVCTSPGAVQGRNGLRTMSFVNQTTTNYFNGYQIISVASLQAADGDRVLYLTTDGKIRYGRSPS